MKTLAHRKYLGVKVSSLEKLLNQRFDRHADTHSHICISCEKKKKCDCPYKKRVNWGCAQCDTSGRKQTAWAIRRILECLSILVILAGVARADDVNPGTWGGGYPTHPVMMTADMLYNSCKLAVGMFLNPNVGMPNPKCQYSIGQMTIVQKITGGYLLSEPFMSTAIFLRTDANYSQGSTFSDEYKVSWTGTYEYECIDGFKKTVWQFDPVSIE